MSETILALPTLLPKCDCVDTCRLTQVGLSDYEPDAKRFKDEYITKAYDILKDVTNSEDLKNFAVSIKYTTTGTATVVTSPVKRGYRPIINEVVCAMGAMMVRNLLLTVIDGQRLITALQSKYVTETVGTNGKKKSESAVAFTDFDGVTNALFVELEKSIAVVTRDMVNPFLRIGDEQVNAYGELIANFLKFRNLNSKKNAISLPSMVAYLGADMILSWLTLVCDLKIGKKEDAKTKIASLAKNEIKTISWLDVVSIANCEKTELGTTFSFSKLNELTKALLTEDFVRNDVPTVIGTESANMIRVKDVLTFDAITHSNGLNPELGDRILTVFSLNLARALVEILKVQRKVAHFIDVIEDFVYDELWMNVAEKRAISRVSVAYLSIADDAAIINLNSKSKLDETVKAELESYTTEFGEVISMLDKVIEQYYNLSDTPEGLFNGFGYEIGYVGARQQISRVRIYERVPGNAYIVSTLLRERGDIYDLEVKESQLTAGPNRKMMRTDARRERLMLETNIKPTVDGVGKECGSGGPYFFNPGGDNGEWAYKLAIIRKMGKYLSYDLNELKTQLRVQKQQALTTILPPKDVKDAISFGCTVRRENALTEFSAGPLPNEGEDITTSTYTVIDWLFAFPGRVTFHATSDELERMYVNRLMDLLKPQVERERVRLSPVKGVTGERLVATTILGALVACPVSFRGLETTLMLPSFVEVAKIKDTNNILPKTVTVQFDLTSGTYFKFRMPTKFLTTLALNALTQSKDKSMVSGYIDKLPRVRLTLEDDVPGTVTVELLLHNDTLLVNNRSKIKSFVEEGSGETKVEKQQLEIEILYDDLDVRSAHAVNRSVAFVDCQGNCITPNKMFRWGVDVDTGKTSIENATQILAQMAISIACFEDGRYIPNLYTNATNVVIFYKAAMAYVDYVKKNYNISNELMTYVGGTTGQKLTEFVDAIEAALKAMTEKEEDTEKSGKKFKKKTFYTPAVFASILGKEGQSEEQQKKTKETLDAKKAEIVSALEKVASFVQYQTVENLAQIGVIHTLPVTKNLDGLMDEILSGTVILPKPPVVFDGIDLRQLSKLVAEPVTEMLAQYVPSMLNQIAVLDETEADDKDTWHNTIEVEVVTETKA